jgi:hypothetical protein
MYPERSATGGCSPLAPFLHRWNAFAEDVVAVMLPISRRGASGGLGKSARPWAIILRHALLERIIEARWETIHDLTAASF